MLRKKYTLMMRWMKQKPEKIAHVDDLNGRWPSRRRKKGKRGKHESKRSVQMHHQASFSPASSFFLLKREAKLWVRKMAILVLNLLLCIGMTKMYCKCSWPELVCFCKTSEDTTCNRWPVGERKNRLERIKKKEKRERKKCSKLRSWSCTLYLPSCPFISVYGHLDILQQVCYWAETNASPILTFHVVALKSFPVLLDNERVTIGHSLTHLLGHPHLIE